MKITRAEIKIQESGFLEKGRGQEEAYSGYKSMQNEEFYSSKIKL